MAGITSNPRVTAQLLEAGIVDAYEDRRDLIVGQLGTGATATSGALVQNVEGMIPATLRGLFGSDELYHRILAWQAGNGGYSPLHVIGLTADGGATAATSTLTFAGTATAAGTYTVSFADEKKFKVEVAVASGDAAADVAAAVDAAFDALINYPPFTVTSALGVATFTADDAGTMGNFYGIKVEGVVAGLTATAVRNLDGATDPAVTSLFDVVDGIRYTGVNWPENWRISIATLTDFLDARFNVSNDVLDGMGFQGRSNTYATLLTAVETLNSQSLVLMGNNQVSESSHRGPAIMSFPSWDSAFFQGLRAKRLTPNAPIASDVIATGGPLDAIGGPHTASLPYFNTPMRETAVTAPTNLFTSAEQVALESAGFTTYGVNQALNTMIMGPVVTTRTTDTAGNENDSFHYLNFVDTGSICREIFFRTLKATFAQSRLTEGDIIPGYSAANEGTIRAEVLRIYRTLANQMLVQAGTTAEAYFADNTTVAIDLASRTATITSLLPIVTQLGVINYPLTLSFTTEG